MTLVYLAHGREDILNQAIFSLVSLFSKLKETSPLKIVIVTDRKKYFEDYLTGRVEIIEVSADQIKKWRGANDFVHRVKIEAVRAVASTHAGPIFFVDSDTFFREDPTALFSQVNDQVSLMHVAETVLKEGRDPLTKKLAQFYKKNKFEVAGQAVHITPEITMWNSGLFGISENNKKLFDLVLELTDKIHAVYPKHINEQLAFSYYLQTRTRVLPADRVVGHYWPQKEDYQKSIDLFLSENSNLEKALSAYPKFVHPAPKIKRETKKPFWQSWFTSLSK
jgi:hypothetical protein